jgi:RNA ligase
MIETVKNPENGEGREGFVIVWPTDEGPWDRVKLKFAHYVQLHGIYTGLTNRKVWEVLQDDTWEQWNALLEIAPDELHDAIKSCAREIGDQAEELELEAVELAGHVWSYPHRKAQAEYILAHSRRPVTSLAFAALDGKNVGKLALQQVKPEESRVLATTLRDE